MLVFALSDYLQREEDEDMQALLTKLNNPELIRKEEAEEQ